MMINKTDQPQTSTMGAWHRLFYRGPATETLYNDYARQRRIDHTAPITASRKVIVDAPVGRVWQLLSQPENWEAIGAGITNVEVQGVVAEGSRFSWRSGRTRLASRFAVVDVERELTWIGAALGSKVVHRHVLTAIDENTTSLYCEESMAGTLLVLFYSSAKLSSALQTWLSAIKTRAEQ